MILQYLFKDTKYRTELEAYAYEYEVKAKNGAQKGQTTRVISAEKTIEDLNNTCWVVQFKINNSVPDECARHLSIIHDDIISKFDPFTLDNGASTYYNQRLYPLVNIFEMRLRKFLFLSIALADDQGLWKKIKGLDTIDFYTLYVRLFTSSSFNKELYNLFDESKPRYTKAYIQELISAIDENDVLWDVVVGEKLQIIKTEFLKLKTFRNDVMHAHYINHADYLKASRLFKAVNNELSLENDNLVKFPDLVNKDDAISALIADIFADACNQPLSVVEEWLNTSGKDLQDLIKGILE